MESGMAAGSATAAGEDDRPRRPGGIAEGGTGALALWGAAIGLAGLGTAIGYGAEPGINWGVWTTMAAAGLLAFARARERRVDPVARWGIGLAVIVAWGAAITANGMFQAFVLVAAVVLLATAARVVGGFAGERVGALQATFGPLPAAWAAAAESRRRSADALARMGDERTLPMVRGLAIGVPVAGGFALVLANADPILERWRVALADLLARLDLIPRSAFFVCLGVIVLGAYGLAARGSGAGGRGAPLFGDPAWRLGRTERRMIVGAVAAVFGVFLAVQPSYLFRDTDALRVSGVSYTEYAHRGFGELTVAATLCVALVLALARYAPASAGPPHAAGEGADDRVPRDWITLLLIGEVLVVLVSAFYRVWMYAAAYGYTELRLYVQAYEVGVAATLLLLALEVAGLQGGFDARRAARRTGVVAAALLIAFTYGNPEGWIVARNAARYRATRQLDVAYLASLSLNAVPGVIRLLPELPPSCVNAARQDLWVTHASHALRGERAAHRSWYEWNQRRTRGLAALVAHVRPRPANEWTSSWAHPDCDRHTTDGG